MDPLRERSDEEGQPSGGKWLPWAGLAGLLLIAGLVGWLFSEYGSRFEWGNDGPRLGALLLILAAAAAGIAGRRHVGMGQALRMASAWLAIGAGIVFAYGYRAEIGPIFARLIGEGERTKTINVASTTTHNTNASDDGRSLTITQSPDGHFYLDARINGSDTRLLVDTGATVTVLNLRHAEQAGIFPAPADFTVQVRTGSGYARAARVTIRELEVGEIRLADISALVMRTPGDLSVLGMSTLQRFKGYEVRDRVLTIRW